jgi:Fe-S cluster assembly ATP-binding protein
MLEVIDLHVDVDGKEILSGINLTVKPGETHAIMGPNGSGKSTLSHIIAGREGYNVTKGKILFNGKSLIDLEPEERAGEGVFLAFQYPIEIAGVNNVYMLKAALNGIRNYRGEKELTSVEFLKLVKSKVKAVGLDESLLNRQVNSGFSGGEKKRNEIFQLSVLEPMLAVLDETDSGLDIDALKAVSDGVNKLRDASRAFVVITHYQRLLDYIVPDYVHVLAKGKIIKTGDKELAHVLESKGYDWLTDSQDSAA